MLKVTSKNGKTASVSVFDIPVTMAAAVAADGCLSALQLSRVHLPALSVTPAPPPPPTSTNEDCSREEVSDCEAHSPWSSKGKTATPVAQQQLPLALSAQNNFKLYTLSDNNTPPLAPQPVGFVTFHTRAGAEAAKQDLQVWNFHVPRLFPLLSTHSFSLSTTLNRDLGSCSRDPMKEPHLCPL